MASVPQTFLTPERYLEQERKADFKSEYLNGETFAMAGASVAHVSISVNLTAEFKNKLSDDCRVLTNDMRVHVEAAGFYAYPDLVVVCGGLQLQKDDGLDVLLNPMVIIEVLSDSTEDYDKGRKFDHYRRLPSFREYVLVSQDKMLVETRVRQGDQWISTFFGEDKRSSRSNAWTWRYR